MLVYMGLIRGIDFFAFIIFHARSVGEFYSYEPFEPILPYGVGFSLILCVYKILMCGHSNGSY